MNILNSPWNKPKFQTINDKQLYFRWVAIKKHLTTQPDIAEYKGILAINDNYYIAKNSSKMRIRSHLDWCWYTPKTLAQAIDSGTVESYYELMLNDVRSDPNLWKDRNFEMELKSLYAYRAGRATVL
jgi:hypothetical protein